MPELNFPNRTLAIMDNIKFLKALNSECIDLIAIDPPFAANETFTGKPRPPITERELAEEQRLAREHGARHNEGIGETRVEDDWLWDKLRHEPWLKEVREDNEEIGALIDAVEMCASENEAAYIAMMASHLLECHRVLKDTGSIYVHCDWHANSYLRMAMDAIFGAQNFRNEVVWAYTGPGSPRMRQFNRKHDTILWYSKGSQWTFNRDEVRVPHKDGGPHAGGFPGASREPNDPSYGKDQGRFLKRGGSCPSLLASSPNTRAMPRRSPLPFTNASSSRPPIPAMSCWTSSRVAPRPPSPPRRRGVAGSPATGPTVRGR